MKKILFAFAAIFLLANEMSAQNGYSTYTWPDGNKFEGYFVNGVMHGSGIHYWDANHYIVGQWVNGAIDGYCIDVQNDTPRLVYYENGNAATRNVNSNQTLNTGVGIYTGEMSNGRACGRGTFRWNSGHCFEGTWTADGKSRYGVLYYPNSKKPWQVGTWTNEQFDGYGCVISESGQITTGLWQNGEYLCKSRLNNAGENSKADDLKVDIEPLCDFTDLFHYGWTNTPKTVFFCEGNSKNTVWMDNIVDYFKFDSNGNLVSHNDEIYTNIVRDDGGRYTRGNLKECVRGNIRIKVINMSTLKDEGKLYRNIMIGQFDAKTNEFKGTDEYILNKQGFPVKRIRKYPSGRKSTRTYKYIDYRDNGVWYIRKVKDSDRLDKTSWYECLKIM